jgi:hypothetical protein
MLLFRQLTRFIALPLAAVMVLVSMPLGAARAALVPTDTVIDTLSAQKDREAVLNFLGRGDVAEQFQSLGLSRAEAEARVAAMSDEEVRQIAGRIDQLPAGQDGFGVIIGALLIVFIILLITDIAGLTDVFPFVHTANKGK